MGTHPKTGKEAPIPPRKVMEFKPSGVLRRRLARPEKVIE